MRFGHLADLEEIFHHAVDAAESDVQGVGDLLLIDSPYVPPVRWPTGQGERRTLLRRVRLAVVPDSPSSPSESSGPRATPCSRPPRRSRGLGAWRVLHVRGRRRDREALPAPSGSEQRRCAGSDSVPTRCAALQKLPAAGRPAGLLLGTPRHPQRPSGGPAGGLSERRG